MQAPSLTQDSDDARKYPPTRFMGSKEKLLPHIKQVAQALEFHSVGDLFSGSGVVAYLFKSMGKQVLANDHMAMSAAFAKAMIENSTRTLDEKDLNQLLGGNSQANSFVQETFRGLYFSQEENQLIDRVRANIKIIRNPHKRAIAMSALIRACIKKRARGVFSYTGNRYDDGRQDLRLTLEEQIRNAAKLINQAVFDNGQSNRSRCGDAMTWRIQPDLVYLDPPYYSPLSDNEYVRRYHFVEGLARDWEGVDIQWHTKTRKFKSYDTPFRNQHRALKAFDVLFGRMSSSIVLLSYSSNSLPTRDQLASLLAEYKKCVEVVEIDHRYSFANQGHKKDSIRNGVKEYLFVGY